MATPGSDTKAKALARLKVLVVDDNKDSAKLLSMMIKMRGHESYYASNGIAALKIVSESRPDVVILDLSMPEMDGFTLCEMIRELPEGKSIYTIAQSGWATDEHKSKAAEAGFDEYLLKPVSLERLEQLLQSVIPMS